ncbi:MAG: hypothetical protein XD36_2110 [Halomonas sp. 54_146]|nr:MULTISPECIES: hypothetical protein [unclassified Halomonas]KUJ87504.1 MAG: hypothetical protein XD36_2110 [Halomonas sp. 54_146]HAA44421.1 hypothetical protein [Halomonas sp.]
MSSFYAHYTFQKAPAGQPLLASNSSYPTIIADKVSVKSKEADLPNDVKGKKLYSLAKSIAEDDAFVKELSDAIGEPRKQETEDMFVERSSKEMKKMLMAKLKKAKA